MVMALRGFMLKGLEYWETVLLAGIDLYYNDIFLRLCIYIRVIIH